MQPSTNGGSFRSKERVELAKGVVGHWTELVSYKIREAQLIGEWKCRIYGLIKSTVTWTGYSRRGHIRSADRDAGNKELRQIHQKMRRIISESKTDHTEANKPPFWNPNRMIAPTR